LAGKAAKDFFSTKGVGVAAKKAEGGIATKAEQELLQNFWTMARGSKRHMLKRTSSGPEEKPLHPSHPFSRNPVLVNILP
jgi:hypothetical protein